MDRRTLAFGIPAAAVLLATVGPAGAHAQGGTINYDYDAIGRLVSAYYPDGTCLAFRYDAAGNRTQYTASAVGPPLANPVAVSGYQDLASSFDPRVNDPVCGALTVSAVGAPGHGTASIVSGGTGVTYTPSAGWLGADTFTYQVSIGSQSSPNGNITVTTQAPSLPPVALGASMLIIDFIVPPHCVTPIKTRTVAPLISDPYGYPLAISQVTQGQGGAVSFNGVSVTYRYNSPICDNEQLSDSFSYTISDAHGHTATATMAVTISVNTNQ